MWISDPIPVTTRIMTQDRLSSRTPNGIESSPDENQVNATCSSGSCELTTPHTAATETPNEAMMAAQATPPDTDFESRRPKNALTTKPRNGSSGISKSIWVIVKANRESTGNGLHRTLGRHAQLLEPSGGLAWQVAA